MRPPPRLLRRRPGPLGAALLLPTWLLLGALLVLYVVGVLALAFAAVLVATVRLLLQPVQALVGRSGRPLSATSQRQSG